MCSAEAFLMDVWLLPRDVVKFWEILLIWSRDNNDRKNCHATRLMYTVYRLTIPGFCDAIGANLAQCFERVRSGGSEHRILVQCQNGLGIRKEK